MQTVRRLYVYLLSGIALAILVYGLVTLLEVLLAGLGIGQGALIDRGGTGADRQQLSLAAALITVGLLVWGIHWWLAERGLAPGRPNAEEERGSTLRALYLTLVLAVLLGFGAWAAQDLLRELVRGFLPQPPDDGYYYYGGSNRARSVAMLLVTGAAWGYHVFIRRRDLARGPLQGAAAWMPRVYVYGVTLVALGLTLQSVGDLLYYAGDALWPIAGSPDADYYRSDGIASAVSLAGVWGIAWLGHWWYAGRLVSIDGWRAAAERTARLRIAFFVGVILAAAFNVVRALTEVVGALLMSLIGSDPGSGGSLESSDLMRAVFVALLGALPWAIAWWLHQRRMHEEALQADDPAREATAIRLDLHAGALVGLGFGAVGVAWLLGLAIDSLFGGARAIGGSGFWRYALATNLPYAAVGLAVWAWRWWPIQARHAANPASDAASTVRRAYLMLVLGAAVISSLGSLAVVLYRLFGTLLGAGLTGDAVSELSTPIGVLLTAAAVALYHGLALRRDLALRAEAEAEAATAPALPGAAEGQAASRRLVLSGPTGAEVEAALERLREALPPGVTLDEG